MENRFQQLVTGLQISSSSSNINLDEVTAILQEQNSELLTPFVSEFYQSIFVLEQWAWQLFSGDVQLWIDKSDYLQLFQTLAAFNKTLIFYYNAAEANMKASLLIPETNECINRIFDYLDKLHDDNHTFIRITSLWFDNLSYLLRQNPEFGTSIVITNINERMARNYVMTDQYKYYLSELRQSPISQSIFTAKQLFYIKTCSSLLSAYLFSEAEASIYTMEEIMQLLGIDYLDIMVQHTYTIDSWSPELLTCITSLSSLAATCSCCGGKIAMEIFPTELSVCEYIDALIRIISYKPFREFISSKLSDDHTILLDRTLLAILKIGESQHFLWFLRSKISLPETLLTIAETSPCEKHSLCSYACLGEILTDERLKNLKVSDNVILSFFHMLEQAWHNPSKKFKQVSIDTILTVFVNLSKIDVIQQKTADTNKIPLLIEMCDEYPMVFDILWALSFNHDIQQQLRSNTSFMAKLAHLPKKCNNEEIRKITHGILWNLESDQEDRTETCDEKAFDIMISYSHKDQSICRRIYDELIRAGYRVWIDFDQMHGNVMDAMAQGIEQSKTIVICMSEQYRRSNYCRAEAHYAFQRQRHIVPVLLQEHYRPDGWLLFLIGHLLYVNFTKHEFGEAMQMLIKEIEAVNIDTTDETAIKPIGNSIAALVIVPPPASPSHLPPTQLKLSENILDWSQTHVHDWLITHQLVQLSRLLSTCNGRSLVYLHDFIKNGNTEEVLSLLKQDSLRLTNTNLSLVELSCFQSLMDEQRNLAGSTNSTHDINIENRKNRNYAKHDSKEKDCLKCCRIM